MGRSRQRRILAPPAVALSAALVVWAAPAALGAAEATQEEAPPPPSQEPPAVAEAVAETPADDDPPEGKIRAPEGEIRVLEPLPINEQLKRTVLDDRLFDAAEPPEVAAPEVAALEVAAPEVAAPEVAAPEATPPAPAADGVFEMVESWVRAWSGQDADRYLSFYSRELETPGGASRQAWERYRGQRISQPESIEVEVSSIQGSVDPGSGGFRLSFRQVYTSDTYADVVRKTLELVREDGGWKIVREASEEWP